MLLGAAAVTTLLAAGVPASAATPADRIPALGAVVTCDGLDPLTGTGGYLLQHERTTFDHRGRAHVRFTIAARHVTLTDPAGRTYRLVGAGYDHVVYPARAVTGPVARENERFVFNVTTGHHVVGVVRFHLHSGPDQLPSIHDRSTCQLPNMS